MLKENMFDPILSTKMKKFLEENRAPDFGNCSSIVVWLGALRALYLLHQTNHWQTYGGQFYGDHLLFQRLYFDTQGEIDTLAEKTVGMSNGKKDIVDLASQMRITIRFLGLLPKDSGFISSSLLAEKLFLHLGEIVLEELKGLKVATVGIENMFGDILDRHETHVYLLQQRNILLERN